MRVQPNVWITSANPDDSSHNGIGANTSRLSCIQYLHPIVYNNIGKTGFEQLETGFPYRGRLVKNHKTGNKANKVFVHFNAMTHRSRDPTINQTIERILEGDVVKIMYDDPWFWNISQSRSKRPAYHKQSPKIVF